jgi:hypothetical protein
MYGMQHFLIKDNLSRVADPRCLSRISDPTTIEKRISVFFTQRIVTTSQKSRLGIRDF